MNRNLNRTAGARAALLGALAVGALALGLSTTSQAGTPVDFVKDVKPILERQCLGCHGPQKQKSGYRIDSKESAMKGGEICNAKKKQALVPKKSGESLLIDYIAAEKEDKSNDVHPMPPKREQHFSAEQIALLKRWVDEGCAWPDGVTLSGGGNKRGGR